KRKDKICPFSSLADFNPLQLTKSQGTKKTTPKEAAFIEKWINNYPKKCLDYKSPREFLIAG
ncbi:TPA: hypothetical protein ACJX66_002056, partial [Streptococcus pneumoniae]